MTHTTQLDANIDDMDPRLWPRVIEKLLEAGALDAWVTPIIMKKGRPAFTLSVLCEAGELVAVRTAVFAETTTIGLRETQVQRQVLERSEHQVTVHGHPVRVKTASLDGEVQNRSVEWRDVIAAANAVGLSAKEVLAAATAAAVRDD